MRYAILADIHSNLTALKAVFRDIENRGAVDEVWCLGDVVGYGPEPGECINLLKKLNAVCVAGNHDLGAIGKIDLSYFNPTAAFACEWTADKLSAADALYLEYLPKTVKKDNFFLVHGSPSSPIFEYMMSISSAQKNLTFFDETCCLVGHTHVPLVFKEEKGSVHSIMPTDGMSLLLGEERMIVNPGAVGQPRDGDPRAAYAIFDTDDNMVRFYRVPYDIRATQDKMVHGGLPLTLVMRLEQGR
jgi:diadenosine tetraphosphatase ApaH/serine/threonine PP2A family protein phosphatase